MVTAVRYDPRHQTQLNPNDPHGGVNCSAYAAAMAWDGATHGGFLISGAQVRAASNEPNPDPQSPGLNILQLVTVGNKFHVALANKTHQSFQQAINDLSKRNEYIVLQGDADQLPNTTFLGPHAITLVAVVSTGIKSHNPLDKAARIYPLDVLRRYAEKFGRANGLGKAPDGDQAIFYASTRQTPDIAI